MNDRIELRCSAEFKQAAKEAAALERRAFSDWLRILIEDGIGRAEHERTRQQGAALKAEKRGPLQPE